MEGAPKSHIFSTSGTGKEQEVELRDIYLFKVILSNLSTQPVLGGVQGSEIQHGVC